MLSFIIPAYNEERLLGATLQSVHATARAVGETYEIIVADDASTDQTAVIAEAQGARVVRVSNRQIAATRNAGARAATGDYFFFVDADTLINESVIRAAIKELSGGVVGGGATVRFDGRLPLYARVLLPLTVGLFRVARLAAGCFIFCTRATFAATGGFDETLYGSEEVTMSKALKRQGRFVVLRESVTTSGRRLRTYSGREMLRAFGKIARRGRKAVHERETMSLWYAERREEPEGQTK